MKTLQLLILYLLLVVTGIKAQNKVERYCKIYVISQSAKGKGDKITIDYGKNDKISAYKDTTMLKSLEKVNELDNCIDALNYLEDLGWEFVNMVPHRALYVNETDRKEFYFRKSFEKK